jgi:hypothetical protein
VTDAPGGQSPAGRNPHGDRPSPDHVSYLLNLKPGQDLTAEDLAALARLDDGPVGPPTTMTRTAPASAQLRARSRAGS